LARNRSGRWLMFLALIGFAIAYLPFFAVQGYADRFAYLASSATAVVLAAAIASIPRKTVQYVAALLLLGFFATGMQNRITAWKEAGAIAQSIPLEVKRELPVFPTDRQVVLLNVPAMHKRSYVYLTSLDRAIERQYPGENVNFTTVLDASIDDRAVILSYTDGHMLRKSLSEALSNPR